MPAARFTFFEDVDIEPARLLMEGVLTSVNGRNGLAFIERKAGFKVGDAVTVSGFSATLAALEFGDGLEDEEEVVVAEPVSEKERKAAKLAAMQASWRGGLREARRGRRRGCRGGQEGGETEGDAREARCCWVGAGRGPPRPREGEEARRDAREPPGLAPADGRPDPTLPPRPRRARRAVPTPD